MVSRVLAERDELWRVPPVREADATLSAIFESLAMALGQRLLVFGRGGFCIHSTLNLQEGPVDLLLNFRADKRRVKGRGVIRWTATPEPELGVEITYINDDARAWVLSLTEPNESLSFIPRTTAVAAPMVAMPVEV